MQQYSKIAAVVAVAAVLLLVANLATSNSDPQSAVAAPDELVSEGSNNSTEVRLEIGEPTVPSEGSNNSAEVTLQIEE